MLLSSSLPFYGKTRAHVVKKILEGKYSFKGRRWNFVSQTAKDFVMNLLSKRPERRPSAEEALHMSWLNRHLEAEVPISFAIMDHVQATIQTFAEYGRLKKLALLVVAYKSTDDEIGFLRKIFKQFDITHDGEVEMHEFKKALDVYHYTDEELERMFMGMDIDGTGKVHYSEFLAATIEAHGSISEERIAEAFDRLDSDDSGYITVENLEDILGDEISKDFVHAIIDEADIDRDHRISYKEFLALWDESYDSKLKHALKDVNNRRVSFDDGASYISEEMETQSALSEGSSELGGGNYFFGVEKEKSIRGVWI
jgi:Ca2+-binding EF-hand superfamily protein